MLTLLLMGFGLCPLNIILIVLFGEYFDKILSLHSKVTFLTDK